MLRIIPQSNSTAAKGYYSRSDYYASGLEEPARWGGQGAKLLGLSGEVTKAQFDALCDNLDPRTGDQLTPRTRTGRTVLYDFNVHVPKSLSVLIERTDDPRLTQAVQSAVVSMMVELEAEMMTRVRRNGQDTDRHTDNLVWAMIPHRTSRPTKDDGRPDPHYHLHLTVFNATFDSVEGRWKAGQFKNIVRDAPYWQAQFHARLAKSLSELGYGVDRTATGWELSGVPDSVLKKFSRRTKEVEQLAEELGITDPEAKAKLGATSRQAKQEENRDDLRAYWEARLTPVERESLDQVSASASQGEIVPAVDANERAARYAMEHCFATASVVPEKRLVAEALRYGVGEVTSDGVRAELTRQGVFSRDWEGQRVATSHTVLEEEQKMLRFARTGRGTCTPLNSEHQLQRTWLNEGQQAAVRHVLNSQDRVMLIRGAAGTGKTTLTQEAVQAIQETGKPVLMLAPSADASRGVLRKEGFESADTVAQFLTDDRFRQQARNGVLWVDEAGLLGAPTLSKLFDAAAQLNARVILMGDARQHASVERGASLRILETLAGLPVAAVTDIRRQTGAYKKAVEALAAGEIDKGFGLLDRMGAIHEVDDDSERDRQIAWAYSEALDNKESVLVIAPTHAEGERVAEAIRKHQRVLGQLGEERVFTRLVPRHLSVAQRGDHLAYSQGDVIQFVRSTPEHKAGTRMVIQSDRPPEHPDRFQVYRPEELSIAVGDRLRITANGWSRDGQHRLDNGAVYTVAGFTQRGDVQLANGWVVDQDFGHWSHGVVGTSHSAQGKTVDRVLIAQSAVSIPASSREQFYVSVSRGRSQVEVFTHSKQALRDAVGRSDPRLSATELLAQPFPEKQQLRREPPLRRVMLNRLRRNLWERTRNVQRSEEPRTRNDELTIRSGAGS